MLESVKKFWGFTKPKEAFPLERVSCHFPLWRFEIMPQGQIHHCCPTWLPHSVANITEVSILDAFQSPLAKEIRHEVQAGKFSYCEKKLCPYLSRYINLGKVEAPLYLRSNAEAVNSEVSLEGAKRLLLMLNYDPSCNLRCPSCRNETIIFTPDSAPEHLRKIHAAVLKNISELQAAGYSLSLNITGSGDAFASPLYFQLLQNLEYNPKINLELQTNGVLMDEKHFTPAMFQMVKFIAVSVDAASKPVYDIVRRGGSFSRVQENLTWLDSAISGGRFAHPVYVKVNFIVQKDNFREMAQFARWILGLSSVNQIWFNLIADWGHLSAEAFSDKAIWREEHPEHAEFRAVLKDPILRDPRIDLGNVTSYL